MGALVCSIGLFLGLGPILQSIDPGAGVVDMGALHVVLLAGVKLFFAVSLAWLIITIEFKILDDYVDNGTLLDDWREMNAQTRAILLITMFLGLVMAFSFLCR